MRLLKIITRQSSKNKLYVIINLLGLSIAITVSLLIYSFIIKELQTDEFHKNKKNIYRVIRKEGASSGTFTSVSSSFIPTQYGTFAPLIQNQVSGIESVARVWFTGFHIKTDQINEFGALENACHADYTFFKMFTFPIIQGSINADSPKRWAVISESAAKRYFGSENPIGKSIYIKDDWYYRYPQNYQVAAIMKDIPGWSTIQTDIVLDYRDREDQSYWNCNGLVQTYLLVTPKTSLSEIEKNMHKIYTDIYPYFNGKIKLQPLRNIYFNKESVEQTDPGPQGSFMFTQILVSITLLILFLASCNYIMIKIVQGEDTLKNFAIQRYFGAISNSLRVQFLTETGIYFLIAIGIAIPLTIYFFPFYQRIISPKFPYQFPLNWQSVLYFIVLIGIFITFIGYAISSYFLKKLNNNGIKNTIHKPQPSYSLQKILAFISIVIFCLLLVEAAIVNKQMNFLKHKDLGCNTDNVISCRDRSKSTKDLLLTNPSVINVTIGCKPLPVLSPSSYTLHCVFDNSLELENVEILHGDADYLKTYHISLIKGEFFNPNSEPVQSGIIPVVVNESFVKQAQLKEPIGTIFQTKRGETSMTLEIIGIVKDFNFRPLYRSITPIVIGYSKGAGKGSLIGSSILSIRYQPGKRAEIIRLLAQNNLDISQGEYQYSDLYAKEEAFIRLINITAFIAIFIGGLGIYAFSVFSVNKRKKEIILRKLYGASEQELQQQLNKEFIKLTLLACIFSIPLAYYLIYKWLEKFAYKATLEWYFWVIPILICLISVILIVSWEIRKTIRANPMEYLHNL